MSSLWPIALGTPSRLAVGTWVVAALLGCGDKKAEPPPAAAKVSNPTTEAQLTTVKLSPEAVRRLGIATAPVESVSVAPGRTLGGEVMAPPGHALVVSAPVAGTVLAPVGSAPPQAGARVTRGQPLMRLAALPDLARTREDLDVARARLQQMQREGDRTARLHAEQLVSTRDHERAQADLAAARAAFETADAQRRLVTGGARQAGDVAALVIAAPASGTILSLTAGPGQTVAAGTPLVEIVELDRLWVRVPVYAGDASAVNRRGDATIQLIGDEASSTFASLRGVPVTAPPTANAAAASIDLYYAVDGGAGRVRPGQRVSVTVPLSATASRELAIPLSAVVHDIYGGAWAYERTDSVTFVRRRIEVTRIADKLAILSRGPTVGTKVVTDGAAELFGVEFGPGK